MTLLGIDIGGTAVKMGLVADTGALLGQKQFSISYGGDTSAILHALLGMADSFLNEAQPRHAEGIAISATGQVDVHEGAVVGTCGSLPGWEGIGLKKAFSETFACPVTVMNDANCALLGEAWQGGAQGAADVVMVTLGTGVGGGVLTGGRIVSGGRGLAGEIGHMPYCADGLLCTCGNRGCWEQYASVTALLRAARDALAMPDMDGQAFFAMAAAGHADAAGILQAWIQAIAIGLVGLVHLFNPQLLLIGGGVSRQEALLIEPLRARVLQGVMPRYREGLRLEAARLGNAAGMLGAARYWLDIHGT